MYTVDYFIKKFEAIPEENMWECRYGNHLAGCAMGLCSNNGTECLALYDLGNEFFPPTNDVTSIITINNGGHRNYQQPTPKQRILAALYDIKKMQEKTKPQELYKDITRELSVLPEDKIETDIVVKVNSFS